MSRGLLFLVVVGAIIFAVSSANKQGVVVNQGNVEGVNAGFDQYGYNRTARNFVGTGSSWCQGKLHWTSDQCNSYMGAYAGDKLVMKWNAEWDRGNADNWNKPPYQAWVDNEWNGKAGGSGEVWHYKIAWDKDCAESGQPSGTAAKGVPYCIWGPFAMLMSQGSVSDNTHAWDVLLKPAGY